MVVAVVYHLMLRIQTGRSDGLEFRQQLGSSIHRSEFFVLELGEVVK